MTKKFIWTTRVMAVLAFLASSWLVFTVIQNVVTRDQLCSALTDQNRQVFVPQIRKGIEQTKQIHIAGYTDAQKQAAIKQGHDFLKILDKPVC